MNELGDRIQRLQNKQKVKQQADQQTRQQQKQNNRESMPETARIYDLFVNVFGQVKILYAQENGKELRSKGYIYEDHNSR